jgi:hypothetical protein
LLLTEEEEILRNDGKGSWRRKGWSKTDRRLIRVRDTILLEQKEDYIGLFPTDLSKPFSNRELAGKWGCPYRTAQRSTYAMKNAGMINLIKKEGKTMLYGFN